MLEAVFGSLSDGVCLSDGGKIAYLNPAAERILGLEPDEKETGVICDLLCGRMTVEGEPDHGSRCPLRVAQDAPEAVTHRGRHRRTGRELCLRVRCLRLPGTRRPGKGGLHLTLLEDASVETELEALKEDWRSMVVHDIRAPLANIHAALRSLQDERAQPGGAVDEAELLRIALCNCRRAAGLLDDFLDLAKLDAGLMPVACESVPLGEYVERVVGELASLARERAVRVDVEVPPGTRACADPRLLTRVLQNLLHNALKFSPDGGAVRVRAAAVEPGRMALTVRNEGPPIPAASLETLFRRYRAGDGEGARRGTGLGLAFCREALKAMGGDVSAASAAGSGTVFTVLLPR